MLVELKRSAAVTLVLAALLVAAKALAHHGWSGWLWFAVLVCERTLVD